MEVLTRGHTIEFYLDRQWRHQADPTRDSFIVSSDETRVAGHVLVARIEEDGLCYDARGKRIDSLPYLRGYQAASIIRRLDAGFADPERIYYAIEPNECGSRLALTEQLLAAVTKKSTRDRLVSMLFWFSAYGAARVYTDCAIEDAFDALGVPVTAHNLRKTGRDAEVCVLGLGRRPESQV